MISLQVDLGNWHKIRNPGSYYVYSEEASNFWELLNSFWSIFGKITYWNISKLPQQERYLESEVIDFPHLGMKLKKGEVLHKMEKYSGKEFAL